MEDGPRCVKEVSFVTGSIGVLPVSSTTQEKVLS